MLSGFFIIIIFVSEKRPETFSEISFNSLRKEFLCFKGDWKMKDLLRLVNII